MKDLDLIVRELSILASVGTKNELKQAAPIEQMVQMWRGGEWTLREALYSTRKIPVVVVKYLSGQGNDI